MKNNRRDIIKYILIVMLLIISTAGVAYAFFQVTTNNNADTKIKVVTPDESKVEYLTNSSINLQATEPGVESEVAFSVKLTGSTNSATRTSYSINFNVESNTFTSLSTPDLVYSIYTSTDGTNWTEVSSKQNIDVNTLNVGDNKILTNQTLETDAGKTATSYWKIKISYLSLTSVDQSANQNKTFKGSIKITDVD